MNRRAFLAGLAPSPAAAPPTRPAPAMPTPTPLSVDAGLEPYTAPLDRPRAAHLLRRAGFGAPPAAVDAIVGRPGADVVAEMVTTAAALPLPDAPPWADELPPPRNAPPEERMAFNQLNAEHLFGYRAGWLARMRYYGLRERMTLFWHNHFVTEAQTYRLASLAYRYVTVLRAHALGDFKAFVHAVGLDPAMLVYLNGVQNRVGAPNENYARELLELFTMGQYAPDGSENYTQNDIEELARALTGWVIDERTLSSLFIQNRHDVGRKIIFGRESFFDYDDVVNLLFEERAPQIASFIAAKLYKEFVYAAPDAVIVEGLADVLLTNDFNIAAAVQTLLASAHFFDEQVLGAQIKSPVHMLTGFMAELDLQPPPEAYLLLLRYASFIQQELLSPPNVAGWPGHHAWLSTSTLPLRWLAAEQLVNGGRAQDGALDLRPLATALTDPEWDAGGKKLSPFYLPEALAAHLLAVPLEHASIADVSEPFAGDLDAFPIPAEIADGPDHVRNLAKLFLAGTPWYEWDNSTETAAKLLRAFVVYLTQLPEYQLT